jgi:predicted DCC family thiol-disulfide oxidoreductase YuxK
MQGLPDEVRVGRDELSTRIVVLYDGMCGLCNRFNRFLLRRDLADRFRLASLESQCASRVLARHAIDPDRLDTVYVVRDYGTVSESLLAKGDAVAYVLREVGGRWSLVAAAIGILPQKLRSRLYDLVAAHRYRLFGKYQVCPMPLPEYRKKYIEE